MSVVLVTGGLGFIGSHVARALVEEGRDVRILDSELALAHSSRPVHPVGAEVIVGDVRDAATVRRALSGVGAVSHQAAMVGLGVDFADAPAYVGHNDLGTAVLLAELAATRFRGHLVLASSMVVYGEGGYRCPVHGQLSAPPRALADLAAGRFEPRCGVCDAVLAPVAVTEDAPMDPRSVYAATKLQQEHLAMVFGRESGVPVVRLRYHNVYGPGMPRDTPYAGVASIFRSALERNEVPLVFEDGRQLRDFVHVSDVADANLKALRDDAPPGAFNVASGEPRSVADMASALASALDPRLRPVVTGDFRAGDVRHVFASPVRASEVLGFTAKVGFDEGMASFARAPLRGSGATSR